VIAGIMIVPVFVPVSVVPVITNVHVFVVHVSAVEPVFMTIVICLVTGSMTIWKFPVESAFTGNMSRRAATRKNIQNNFLSTEKGSVMIYDILGKEIVNREIEPNTVTRIDMNNDAQAIYFVKITTNSQTITKKICINK